MPKVMIEVDIPKGRSIAEAEGAVKRAFDPDWMASWWHISDVQDCFNSEEPNEWNITDSEAREVLRRIDKYHNSEVGINWDVIESHCETVVNERKEVA